MSESVMGMIRLESPLSLWVSLGTCCADRHNGGSLEWNQTLVSASEIVVTDADRERTTIEARRTPAIHPHRTRKTRSVEFPKLRPDPDSFIFRSDVLSKFCQGEGPCG